jgi:hypothetical protein
LYGGAIFFASYVNPSFVWKSNYFKNNIAKFYGDNWASLAFRLVLTEKNVSIDNFTSDEILNSTFDSLNIKSNENFDLPYLIWVIDQFNQSVFIEEEM